MAGLADMYLLASTVLTTDEHLKIALDATELPSDATRSSPTSTSNPRRIFVIVSNVSSNVEEACILVLKPRNKDPNTAALLKCIPILPGLEISLGQQAPASPPSIQTVLDSIQASSPPSDPGLSFTFRSGLKSASATTTDTQGLSDFLSVLRDLLRIAKENNFSLATSHRWLSAYTNDAPLVQAVEQQRQLETPIFSRFSQSAILPDEDRPRPPSPGEGELRISIGSFNVNGQWPPEDPASLVGLKRWIRVEEDPDIIALGFQEVDTSSGAYLYYSPAREEAWTTATTQALGRRADEYTKIASKQLVGLLVIVFARVQLATSITGLATASVGVGLGGFVANKGAVAVRMQLGDRSLCLVNAHLSAYEGLQAMERRCWDWSEIYRRLRFKLPIASSSAQTDAGDGKFDTISTDIVIDEKDEGAPAGAQDGDSDSENEQEKEARRRYSESRPKPVDGRAAQEANTSSSGDEMTAAWKPTEEEVIEHSIRDHDVVFHFGDLNFRVDLARSEVQRLIHKRQYSLLYRYDQLESLRTSGSLFDDFEEGEIKFAPTYKFDKGTDQYDTSEKQRVPSWTDRILWADKSDAGVVTQQAYESVEVLRMSDHKPVRGTFLVRVS